MAETLKAHKPRRFRGPVDNRPPPQKGMVWVRNGREAWKEVPFKG